MTRKDYVAIAGALRYVLDVHNQAGNNETQSAIHDCVAGIANVMAQDNPRFDRARFLKACGVQS